MSILDSLNITQSDPETVYTCPNKNGLFGGNGLMIYNEAGRESLDCPLCGKLHTYDSETKNLIVRRKNNAIRTNKRIRSFVKRFDHG